MQTLYKFGTQNNKHYQRYEQNIYFQIKRKYVHPKGNLLYSLISFC